ncbi:MAG: cytochrome c-type biogenesis protein CcmH [Sneathiellales bacterium]|nr:cytochrome c-type biogenesis protein CcmH [Sneathiellales bacterium]
MKILRSCIVALTIALIPSLAGAIFVEERLTDPAKEERVREIADDIRCLVCQNQSIMDSNADLAKDLRAIVRERVAAGDSDDQVKEFLLVRYGDWVLLKPPFRMRTLILWLGPFAVFIGGAIATFLFLRRRSAPAGASQKAKPLSKEEQAAFDALMAEEDQK